MIDLKAGDVVFEMSMVSYHPELQASFKPPKGKVFVTLLLGVADKDNPYLFDSVKALKELGWEPNADLQQLLSGSVESPVNPSN